MQYLKNDNFPQLMKEMIEINQQIKYETNTKTLTKQNIHVFSCIHGHSPR